ncbi:hypothetical protein NDU88_000649 [Pleurodeles waltl]|uniref:Uncharacterized protein n=1 Tax=Pleurodeles waltl TaxID=8319 RepID=A0AAV7U430_PLEWA|nr:hypothetical protein NDU88_000649 [Pleurodeles waltl]
MRKRMRRLAGDASLTPGRELSLSSHGSERNRGRPPRGLARADLTCDRRCNEKMNMEFTYRTFRESSLL